ncbi:MAG: GH116 family glycosyl hydrolase [Capsulimonadaceae bacterium]|nr:GH116 family glycosyl hydrolase [Capsulimonadaceae bacterium]
MIQITNTNQKNIRLNSNQRNFSGDALSEIAFPLGGIGTGTISLGGRGNLRDFEIFNHPDKGNNFAFTFFALRGKTVSSKPFARILEGAVPPPYRSGFGESPTHLIGVPRFAHADFKAEYPTAQITLTDPGLPVSASLIAWNPFIPLNVPDSALPAALFEWTITNEGNEAIEISLAASLSNPLTAEGATPKPQSGSLNSERSGKGTRGVFLTHPGAVADAPETGTLALTTSHEDVDIVPHWFRGAWFDKSHLFWDQFAEDGRVEANGESPAPVDGDTASIVLHATIPAHGSVTLPVSITWLFPRMKNPWRDGDEAPAVLETYAGARHADAWAVAEYVNDHLPRLRAETDKWRTALFSSTLPETVLEAISSQASIIRTPTCLLLADGRFFGWEGCSDKGGCCKGSCTHVWNYEQSLAFLFPELERTMRQTEFLHNTRESGNMGFRTNLPPGSSLSGQKPCADGQMGTIIQVYRDWQLSGDDAFLREVWPGVKRALEYAWTMTTDAAAGNDCLWDPDKDGLMEGEQHNTYDIEFFGPNPLCSVMYLGALKACEEIARHLGETAKAAEYRAVYESGQAKIDAELWNGEYFIQKVHVIPEIRLREDLKTPSASSCGPSCACGPADGKSPALESANAHPKYQHGTGCLSDQLLGQWASHVAGLGYVIDPAHAREAIKAVYRYNFRSPLADHANVQRVYAFGDEAGLLVCSWPKGGREVLPLPYSDEVWTGMEYQVAGHLIYEGAIDEGLAIVDAVAARYSGNNRNPWNQVECGHHYARAMASWSVKLALDGFSYSVPNQAIGFAPKVASEMYRTFWSIGTGWGTFEHDRTKGVVKLTVLHGTLTLRTLAAGSLGDGAITASHSGQPIQAKVSDGIVTLASPAAIKAGETLEIRATSL